MGKAGLRIKILLGALILVVIVSGAITAVVSTLVTRQNKGAVNAALDKSLTIVRDSLEEDRTSFLDTIVQMSTVNKVGDDVKFLTGFQDGGLTLVRSNYEKITTLITNAALLNHIWAVRIYNTEKTLFSYFQRNSDTSLVSGFQFQKKFYSRVFKPDEDYNKVEFRESSDIKEISSLLFSGNEMTRAGKLPEKGSVSIEVARDLLGFETRIPLFANVYNKETEQTEPRQVGFIVAISRLGRDFAANMKRITGMGMNLFIGDQYSTGDYPAYAKVDLSTVPEVSQGEKPKFHFSETRFGDQDYFQVLMPFYSGGKRIGGVLLLESDANVKANTRQMVVMISLVALGCIILVVPLAWFVAGKVVNPLVNLRDKLKDIAEGEGDLRTRLEITSKDEIGQLAAWFNTFIDKIHVLIREVAQNSDELNLSSTDLAKISKVMADGAAQTSDQANSVSAASEEMSTSMTSVATSMGQAAENMAMVSKATGEMTQTINEISQNTQEAREITGLVKEKTGQASDQIEELGSAAREIGEVVETITDISGQVNLLALNATIEAARAGEAGKGFAVVANEIKELADQTAGASKDIKEKVEKIRTSTGLTVDQINEVAEVVNKVNEIVLIIASAVEEQSATTSNISDTISQVTQGIDSISSNVSQSSGVSSEIAEQITGVTKNAEEMSQSSSQVDTRSGELSRLAEKLMALVQRFKI
ncbi:methyl-accepting chemotaxis protein [Desulfospira joergensenii]|uniref:methyl-accepting chemotaxis protein n=1 Tax=Desulfospira joergensenii TaxID=53329 RepID=UPI0003B7238F|nr:methyl-accepting chemotaxis protein [Desulfospira joergensenii]